jgi:predicted ATPase
MNPYATALDGLVLDDPVAAFFGFCRERENIRRLREGGAPAPWSDDPVFQRGRFLNIFREDDRGSKAIHRFAEPCTEDLSSLVHALFFARWCNRQSTLDALSADLLQDPTRLRHTLENVPEQPWCNVAAYPVEPVQWDGAVWPRFDTATQLFGRIKTTLTDAILGADGDVVRATDAVNALFGMKNDFPIFMAIIDLAGFRPDVIDPSSPVPTGIGAVAFLDRLQEHLGLEDHHQTCEKMIALQAEYWPEAKRAFQPIDIEYLSCECRKYYSYVNGTKTFEGKNLFRPGQSAQLVFDPTDRDLATERIQTRIQVIAGGPCSGKTSVLKALEQAGHRVVTETSQRLLEAGIAKGQTAQQLRADPVLWQQEILRLDHALFDGLPVSELVFTDTSFIEDLVFAARAGIVVGPRVESWLRRKRYQTVFFLDPLEDYEQSQVRIESRSVAMQISDDVRERYQHHGYALVPVPSVSVAERVAFIEAHIAKNMGTVG